MMVPRLRLNKVMVILILLLLAFFPWLPGGDPLNPQTGLRGYVEFAFTVLAFFFTMFWWPSAAKRAISRFVWFLLPGIWAVMSSLWSYSFLLTLGKAVVFALTLFISVSLALVGLEMVAWMRLVLFSLLGVITLGFALNLFYYGTPLYLGQPFGPVDLVPIATSHQRLVLAAAHPLVVGHLFALTFLFIFASFLSSGSHQRVLRLLLLVLAFVGLILANARASIVATLVSAFWSVFLIFRRRLRLPYRILFQIAILSLGVVLLLWVVAQEAPQKWLFALAPDYETLNGRIPLWQDILREVSQNSKLLWLGTGFGATRFLTFDLAYWRPGHTHNGYLEILAGTGLIGIVFSLPMLLAVVKVVGRFPEGSLALYFLLMSFFNPTFQGDITLFLSLTTVLLKHVSHAHSKPPHLLSAAGR